MFGIIFLKIVQFIRYWKSKKISGYCMYTFIQKSFPVVFKHFRVLLAACVINFHLEHSFYIDINKNIISYFNTLKMLSVFLLPVSCKKMNHRSFLMHFGQPTEDKCWLGVGLGSCDRPAVATMGVNLGWFGPSFCNRRVIA